MTKARTKTHRLSAAARAGGAKRIPRPVTLPEWDMGATGPANRAGLVIEEAADMDPETGRIINPNGVKRARRVDMLEVWHRKGVISTQGYNAAEALRDAFEATERTPGWPDNDRVQSSPKPDHAVTIQIDTIRRFHAVHRFVPAQDRAIIDACVLRRASPAYAGYRGAAYRDGLQHLADALDRLSIAMGRRKTARG